MLWKLPSFCSKVSGVIQYQTFEEGVENQILLKKMYSNNALHTMLTGFCQFGILTSKA